VLEGDPDFDDLTDHELQCPGEALVADGQKHAICQKCGRTITIEGKRAFASRGVQLDWSGIIRFVKRLLSTHRMLLRNNRVRGLIEARFNKTNVKVCFPETCESDLYLTWFEHFVDPIVYIISDTGRIRMAEYPTDTIVITLSEVLSADHPDSVIANAIEEAAEVITRETSRVNFVKLEAKFDRSIKQMTPSNFEAFIGRVLDNARRDPQLLETYRRKLNRRSRSLLGALIRIIGGTGAEDIMIEPKAEYLGNFFSGSGTYEMKRYSSSLKLADLRELLDHCEQRGTSGILFTSASRVASSVWSRIRYIKTAQGVWKYIVVDHDLLLELLIELRLTTLLTSRN
jgi:hypothetical protein